MINGERQRFVVQFKRFVAAHAKPAQALVTKLHVHDASVRSLALNCATQAHEHEEEEEEQQQQQLQLLPRHDFVSLNCVSGS